MRIGIYGGTFDPVHFGHLVLAETCRELCALDEVWFVPAAVSPHKLDHDVTSARQRMEMLRFAIAGHAQFRISKVELERPAPSYTVETLRQLRSEDPTRELLLLMGADSLTEFPRWREPREILELAEVVAVSRGREPADLTPVSAELGDIAERRIRCLTMPALDISASDLRQRAATGRSLRFLTPRPVELFIQQHHLYTSPSNEPA